MTGPRFDPQRSDAIRTMLIDTVEQTPARDHRRHVRIVVLAILAALGIGVGSSAVAMALGGLDLFAPPAATQVVVAPATASPTQTPTPSATPTPEPHPLVVTGDPIAPRDVVSAPPASPAWSIDVPGAGDPCQPVDVMTVSDGYALVQSGPTAVPEDVATNGCEPTETHLWLSLVDTRDGTVVWTRDWTWPHPRFPSSWTQVSLLGTSGKVLVRTTLQGVPASDPYPFEVPNEVLDLASGTTLGEVSFGTEVDSFPQVLPLADDSGDVLVSRQVDEAVSEVVREDPLNPSAPVWTIELPASGRSVKEAPIDSSVLAIEYAVDGSSMIKVVDVDSGALMTEGPDDRQYTYLDGVTLRGTRAGATQTSVAGIDAAGNEFWNRTDPDGLIVLKVRGASTNPFRSLLSTSDVLVKHADGRLESIDGLTGETRWVADGSGCDQWSPFQLEPDGVLIQWKQSPNAPFVHDPRPVACAFTPGGEPADVSSRPDILPDYTSARGGAAAYDLQGGWSTGGVSTYKYHSPEGTVPTATVRDAVTGAVLWTRPIASDERWAFAGGYLVGLSGGTMFGIG